MTQFYNFLNEKLIKINDQDINMIFKPLKPWADYVNKLLQLEIDGDLDELGRFRYKNLSIHKELEHNNKVFTINSSELTSKKAQLAHKLNPIKILIRPGVQYFAYAPLSKEIHVGFVKPHLDIVLFNDMHQIPKNS